MKPRERLRFIATIDTLKRVAEEYSGKTIENIITQMEARWKEVKDAHQTRKQISLSKELEGDTSANTPTSK